MNLVPVDADPFAVPSPLLVPVDHDPFASPDAQQAAAPGVMAGVSRALEANLPFVDRAVAAAKSSLPQGYGGTGKDYAANLTAEKAKNAQFAEQNPWTNAVGGLTAYAPAALLPGGSGLYGRIGTGALTGFGLGGLQGASNSPDLTNTAETGRDIAQGEATGAAFGAFAPAAAHGIGAGYSALAGALRGGPGPADLAALGAAKNVAYQNVKDLGAAYSPQSFKSLTDKIASDAVAADIDPDLNPKASKIIANLQNRSAEAVKSGTPVTLTDLDKARQFVNDNLSGLPEPKQARFGALIKNNIDDFVNTAFPGDMVPMPAKGAGSPTPAESLPSPAQSFKIGDVDVHDSHRGEMFGTKALTGSDGQIKSAADVNILGDTVQIQDIRTRGGEQRKGYATALVNDLFHEFPDKTIQLSNTTDDGSKFFPAAFNVADDGTITPKSSATPSRPQVPPGPAPTSMLDFLRRAGGLKDEGGDLSSMGFSNLKGVAGKGSSKIIDKENGLPMDEARRMAVESGYMEPHETVSDFINKLGEHPTYSQNDEEAVAARAARDAYDRGPHQEEVSPLEARRAPEDFSGLGEAPPIASRPSITTLVTTAAPSGPVASAQEAADAISTARDLAQRQFKANALAKALDKAEIRAETTGSYGNIENTTRQRLAALYEKEPWTPDEFAQLKKMAQGTTLTNALSRASKLSPLGHALPFYADIAGAGLGHAAIPGLPSAIGIGAQIGSTLARRNAQNKLMSTILAGGKAPVKGSPLPAPVSRAAMSAALAANAQRNQATPQ